MSIPPVPPACCRVKRGSMRILNVCETARGGVGVYQRNIAGLGALGHDVHTLLPEPDMAFVGSGLQVHGYPRSGRNAASVRALVGAFHRLVKALDPTVCLFHSTFTLAPLAMLRATRDRRPAVYCPHGWAVLGQDPASVKGRLVRAVEGRLCGLADRVLCVSRNEAEVARTHGYRGRMVVIENGVPPATPGEAGGLPLRNGLNLLFVGRLDRQKGLDLLLAALRGLPRRDLHLHVVGEAVRGGADPGTIPPNVTFHGPVGAGRIDAIYRSADALIVPSRWEGLPLVIPEALRNGTPVLCARRSGMADLIAPGVTGQSFALSPAGIAGCLLALDKARLAAMRPACAASWAARFTVDRMVGELDALLAEVVGGRA